MMAVPVSMQETSAAKWEPPKLKELQSYTHCDWKLDCIFQEELLILEFLYSTYRYTEQELLNVPGLW